MAGKSTWASDLVLQFFLRSSKPTAPTTVYAGLMNADPTDAFNPAVEIAATGGYSRVAVPATDAWWTAPLDVGAERGVSNAQPIVFGTPSGADWNGGNPITHFGLFDAPTAGHLLYSAALGTARVVQANDNAPTFAVGAFQVREG